MADPIVLAILSGSGVIVAAVIGAFVNARIARSQFARQIEASKVSEREGLHKMLTEHAETLRKETDSLRDRVRNTETELSECVKRHLQAELALMKAGIKIE